ncbi:hypothetical protein NPIL_380401, partial [Nephila pilipes]
DTIIDGYWIPKRSLICANLGSIHFDPEIYPDPEKFQLERFLKVEEKSSKREGPYPFGIGKYFDKLLNQTRRRCAHVLSSML